MEGLGIDLRLLAVQIINFLVLLFVLKKWVYKPFLKFLDDRAEKIHESLKASEKMRKEMKAFETKKEEEMANLKQKSQAILDEVRQEATKEKKKMLEEAGSEAKSLLEAARIQAEADRQKASKQMRDEVSELALEISKRIFSEIDEEKAHKIVDRSLQENESKKE